MYLFSLVQKLSVLLQDLFIKLSKAESIGALAPSLRSRGEWDTAADDPERPSAKKRKPRVLLMNI